MIKTQSGPVFSDRRAVLREGPPPDSPATGAVARWQQLLAGREGEVPVPSAGDLPLPAPDGEATSVKPLFAKEPERPAPDKPGQDAPAPYPFPEPYGSTLRDFARMAGGGGQLEQGVWPSRERFQPDLPDLNTESEIGKDDTASPPVLPGIYVLGQWFDTPNTSRQSRDRPDSSLSPVGLWPEPREESREKSREAPVIGNPTPPLGQAGLSPQPITNFPAGSPFLVPPEVIEQAAMEKPPEPATGEPPGISLGDQILRGLQKTVAPETPAASARAGLAELAEQLASRILVSSPEKNEGTREVRIQLREDLAAGAEFSITRDTQGLLQVVVRVPTEGMAFWVQQRDDLQRHLRDRLKDSVQVKVEGRDGSSEESRIVDQTDGNSHGQGSYSFSDN
ncbi:MAG: hypothetical protein WCP34_03095 [Pseudomonadota bacterium]